MEIYMEDIFFGFIKRYETFQLKFDDVGAATHYTREILRHFEQLGVMVGYKTRYEKQFTKEKDRRYDLIWYENNIEKPFLHVEHENRSAWNKLEDTVNKIDESICDNVIAIMYPSESLWEKVLELLFKRQKKWSRKYDILVILDPFFITHDYTIEGHFLRPDKNTVEKATIMKNEKTGNLYAFFE